MPKENVLVIGDKLSVTDDGVNFYKTTVGDIYRNGLILIGTPIYKEEQMELKLSDEIYLIFYRENGRYITKTQVVDFQVKDGVRYALLEQLTEPEKDQRREHYRLTAGVGVEAFLCEYIDGIEMTLSAREDIKEIEHLAEARARDISVSGIALITTKRQCAPGEKYLIKLYFDGFKSKNPPFLVCANVIRSVLNQDGNMYDVGMQFFGLPKDKDDFLAKYIITEQQKRILKRKLIEGE